MGTILVVDDDVRNLRVIEAMLLPEGHTILTALNGKECLATVNEAPPDLILLDVMMPGMDGFEVAQQLKASEITKSIPIVMVTALGDVEYRVRALECGASDFLSKPVEKNELRARVDSLLQVKAYYDYLHTHQQQLENEVARRTAQLERAVRQSKAASKEVIYRLVRASEYKDEDTGNHVRRMSEYSAAVARAHGLPADDVENILLAAPMHDVGKIGIPDSVLLKPGKLTEEEWVIMREHTVIGGCILEGSDIAFVDLGRIIAMTHHEKWDGSGYPLALQGDEIPLPGRIVAIADVFDALTSKRPYKEPMPNEKALAILEEGSGKHFDPQIVQAFLKALDDILAIQQKFQPIY